MSTSTPRLQPQQLTAIAQEFGTPVYIYQAEKIKTQYERLTHAFKAGKVQFFYACKALTNISILKYIHSLGSNIDCSSINEVKLALHVGFQPHQILYTSNGIHFQEIIEAKELGVIVNIDSLSNLSKFGAAYGNSYPVSIRLRPNILAGGNLKISTGHDKSKFGIGVDQLEEILAIVKQYQLNITNLHIHTGSDIKDPDVFIKGIEVIFDIIPHFKDLKSIDLGGGFKVPYTPGEEGIDVELLAEKVLGAFESHPQAKGLEIWFEPGKFLVSECGYLVAAVNVLKQTAATTFAGIDTGFNHLLRPMFYDAYHEIENISHPERAKKPVSITGNICETDTFAWDREIAEVQEGDLIAIYNAGAYGFEMSSHFNSRFKPAEVLLMAGKAQLIRERDDLEDILRKQIQVL